MNSLIKLAVAALAVMLSAVLGVQVSGATFVATSGNPVQVNAATDWVPPAVSVVSPGATVAGTAVVSATASDTPGSGVASVQLQYSVADQNAWITLCTDTTAPYSCSWATPQVPDGRYDLRAIATDNVGFTTTSAIVVTRVANNFSIVLADLPLVVKGDVQLTANLVSVGTSTASHLWFEYAPTGTTNWTAVPLCGKQLLAGSFTSRTCTWLTIGNATYDLRAVAIIGASTVNDVRTGITVDNVAPSGTITVPSSPVRGPITLTSTDAGDGDEGSGVASVEFQYRRTLSLTWDSCGVAHEDPFTCTLDTATLANASHDFRAVITDHAGNVTVSLVVIRTVDNTVSTVSISAPSSGAVVKGNAVVVSASANSTRGITSVRLDASRDNGQTWLPICTDTAAPWSCTWDTTMITGSTPHLLRAVMLESDGTVTTSASVAITVDNSPLKGLDVQAYNSGTLGTINRNDSIVLTYSGLVDLTTIRAGWNGSSTSVNPTLRDQAVAGSQVGNFDRFDFSDANLGQVGLAQDQIRSGRSTTFTGSTMAASTATVGGVQVTVVTLTLGTPGNSGQLRSSTLTGTTRWAPSTLVRTPQGVACSSALVLESGTLDRDL